MRRIFKIGLFTSTVVALPLVASAANNPYLEPDGSWITLSGKVTSSSADSFKLDYGDGLVTVEMDDWNWYDADGKIIQGDRVTVYGEVDDDTFESAKIEASSVYVENLGTYFYASAADEESFEDYDMAPDVPIEIGDISLTGTISGVNGREFTIDTGLQKMRVDTATMPYDPTDDEGYQQLDKGDTVTVTGNIEDDTFETRELMADSVITLDDESQESS